MATGGRGLFLIAQLMDEMSLRVDGGLEVSMVKRAAKLGGLPASDATIAQSDPSCEPDYWQTRQQALTDEMGEAFATLDWEYRITYANKAVLQFFGLRLDEVIGTSFWEIFPETSAMPVGAAVREAMALGRSSSKEYVSPKVGRWVEARVYPATFRASVSTCATSTSASARSSSATSTSRRSGKARPASDLCSAPWTTAPSSSLSKWRYLYINDRAVAQTQRPREELIGRVFWDVFPDVVRTETTAT